MLLGEGRDDGLADAMAQTYRDVFFKLRADATHAEPLYPGVRDTLAALSRREDVLLGIATGKSRRGVDHLVDREGWDDLFATIQTADDAPSKPHPGMIRRALAQTGIAAGDAAMVGDTTFDMDMARAAGISAIGVSYGFLRRGFALSVDRRRAHRSSIRLSADLVSGAGRACGGGAAVGIASNPGGP